jgi:hypothetical protein
MCMMVKYRYNNANGFEVVPFLELLCLDKWRSSLARKVEAHISTATATTATGDGNSVTKLPSLPPSKSKVTTLCTQIVHILLYTSILRYNLHTTRSCCCACSDSKHVC